MDDNVHIVTDDFSKPRWEYMAESPIIEQIPSKYKLKLKYGGFFRLVKKSRTKRYCFGFQKSIYIDTYSYEWNQLIEEVMRHYPSNNGVTLSVSFVDKDAAGQSFIELNSDESFMMMLNMYNEEKQVTIYVTTDTNGTKISKESGPNEAINEPHIEDEPHGEDDSDYCPSEESYHSHFSSDNENELFNDGQEGYANIKKNPIMKVNSKFPNVVEFRRALNHHALIHEFEYFIEKSEPRRVTARCATLECEWRIHASIMQDDITFEVKKLVEKHSCIRSNKGGNKCATQGWIADVVKDKLRSDGDVSPALLQKWLMKTYGVDIPYLKVYRGKEQAYTDMYGKWDDSFMKMDVFKEELQNRNPGSVVEIDFEIDGDKKRFLRFFISLAACSKGFLNGCRPYISLDACHLKGKFNGVLAAATGIDGNNSIFPIAYSVLESENTKSWTWFLESLKKAIGTPNGLVISSDMQKGLEAAIMQVYPNVEHREWIRHLYRNFKSKFRGDFFNFNLWGASITYCPSEHDRLLKKIADVREDAITYLSENHKRIWSRSKFGTTSKCDYITNNISEVFNSWIGSVRYKPVLQLLDSIRGKLMKRFGKKQKIVKKWNDTLVPKAKNYLINIFRSLGEYKVRRSSENRAEVEYKGKQWDVMLDQRTCSCRVWQVKGLPCVHAAAFIAFIRDTNWGKYVDPYFTVDNFKKAYALEISPMPAKDQWIHEETSEKIYPPNIKRPAGRPKKNRIVSHDELKKKQKCLRCGQYGHRQKRCKNSAYQVSDPSQASTSKRGQGRKRKATGSCTTSGSR